METPLITALEGYLLFVEEIVASSKLVVLRHQLSCNDRNIVGYRRISCRVDGPTKQDLLLEAVTTRPALSAEIPERSNPLQSFQLSQSCHMERPALRRNRL